MDLMYLMSLCRESVFKARPCMKKRMNANFCAFIRIMPLCCWLRDNILLVPNLFQLKDNITFVEGITVNR